MSDDRLKKCDLKDQDFSSKIDFYKLYREKVTHEDALINFRTSWFVTLQAFLFTSFSLINGKIGLESAPFINILLAFVGLSTSWTTRMSVLAAHEAIDTTHKIWNDEKIKVKIQDYVFPPLMGASGTTGKIAAEGGTSSVMLPLFISLAWLAIVNTTLYFYLGITQSFVAITFWISGVALAGIILVFSRNSFTSVIDDTFSSSKKREKFSVRELLKKYLQYEICAVVLGPLTVACYFIYVFRDLTKEYKHSHTSTLNSPETSQKNDNSYNRTSPENDKSLGSEYLPGERIAKKILFLIFVSGQYVFLAYFLFFYISTDRNDDAFNEFVLNLDAKGCEVVGPGDAVIRQPSATREWILLLPPGSMLSDECITPIDGRN